MARRVLDAERAQGASASAARIDLSALRQLDAAQVLGLSDTAGDEELGQVRRRFATAFHSDRVAPLPSWVKHLFDEILGMVNEACDRLRR